MENHACQSLPRYDRATSSAMPSRVAISEMATRELVSH